MSMLFTLAVKHNKMQKMKFQINIKYTHLVKNRYLYTALIPACHTEKCKPNGIHLHSTEKTVQLSALNNSMWYTGLLDIL